MVELDCSQERGGGFLSAYNSIGSSPEGCLPAHVADLALYPRAQNMRHESDLRG